MPPNTEPAIESALERGHLSRNARIEIRALRKYAEWIYKKIALATPYTLSQVQYAYTNPVTPRH